MIGTNGQLVDFDISVPVRAVTHIKEKSSYDNNYYRVENYGDWFYGEYDVIHQRYHECENCYSYELGRFIENNFVMVIGWTTQTDIFNK